MAKCTAAEQKAEKRVWSHNQTVAFLQSYQSRQHEFSNPKKKKHVYENILEDLISMNLFGDVPTTTGHLKTKMNSLLRAYKAAKDNEESTGEGPSRFKFMKLMDEIFGDRPIVSNKHTINLNGEKASALPILKSKSQSEEDASTNMIVIDESEEEGNPPIHSRNHAASTSTQGVSTTQSTTTLTKQAVASTSTQATASMSTQATASTSTQATASTSTQATASTSTQATASTSTQAASIVAPAGASNQSATYVSSPSKKKKSLPYSYKSKKSVKEILQEKQLEWEQRKFDAKQKLKMEMFKLAEANKNNRFEKRKEFLRQNNLES